MGKAINSESLGARVRAYTSKPAHAKVEGVSGPGAEGESDIEGEADKMDPWSEVHKHLDRLHAALKDASEE